MGCCYSKRNKETPGYEEPTVLAAETPFTVSEVEALYELFKKLSSSVIDDGLIHKEELQLALFRNKNKRNLFADRIFDLFDVKRNGVIEFGEFVRCLVVFHPNAPVEDKIHWLWRGGEKLEICTTGLEFELGRALLVRVWNNRGFIHLPGPTKCVFRGVWFPRIQRKKMFSCACQLGLLYTIKTGIAFRLYDLRQTGFIEREELKEMVVALLHESDLLLSDDCVEAIVEKTFSDADLKGDGKIDPDEWNEFVSKNPSVMKNMTLPYLKDITLAFPSFLSKTEVEDSEM